MKREMDTPAKACFWLLVLGHIRIEGRKNVDLQNLRPACSVQALDHPSQREEKKLKKKRNKERNGQCGKL